MMWTGEKSLRSINSYISGYYHALSDHKIVLDPLSAEPFFDWVANKLGYHESTAGWVNMILAFAMGFRPGEVTWDEVLKRNITEEEHIKSIELFYKLVDEFKREHPDACESR